MSKEQAFPVSVLEKYISQQLSQVMVAMSNCSPTSLPILQGNLIALKKFAVDHELKIKIELRMEHIFPNVVKEKEEEPESEQPTAAVFVIDPHDGS